jgi:ABC-2 type transport system permease protein
LIGSLLPILRVTERDLRAQLRSRTFLVQTLLLPLLLTFIIGNALGGSKAPEPVPVVIVGTENRVSAALREIMEFSKLGTVRYASKTEGQQLMDIGKVIVMLEFPQNAEQALLRSREFEIKLSVDPASHYRGAVIESLVQGFGNQLEVTRATLLGAVRALKPENSQALATLLETVQTKVQKDFEARAPTIQGEEVKGRQAGFFTYYAIAFGVMFTLLSATHGAGSLVEEFERGTIQRLLSAPLTPTGLLIGKFLALWAMASFQLGSFVILSSLLYGVTWGEPFGVIVTLLATAAAAAGFGGIIIGLANSHEQVNVLGLIFVLVMSLLGGSMYPVDSLPGLAQQLSRLTYNRWSIEAFQLLSSGLNSSVIALDMLVLIGMAVAGLTIGAVRLSRRFAS